MVALHYLGVGEGRLIGETVPVPSAVFEGIAFFQHAQQRFALRAVDCVELPLIQREVVGLGGCQLGNADIAAPYFERTAVHGEVAYRAVGAAVALVQP